MTDIRYKQIVIAMGEGAKAALSASEDRCRPKGTGRRGRGMCDV